MKLNVILIPMMLATASAAWAQAIAFTPSAATTGVGHFGGLLNVATGDPVVSAASYARQAVAPVLIVTILDDHWSASSAAMSMLPLPINLAGTAVTVVDANGNSILVPQFHGSPQRQYDRLDQANVVPPDLSGKGDLGLTIAACLGTRNEVNLHVSSQIQGRCSLSILRFDR